MGQALQFTISKTVAALPDSWDGLASGNIFLSTDYLKVLEHSKPENMTCFFIGIHDAKGLAGIAIAQFLDLGDVTSFGERDSCFRRKVRDFAFRRFTSHILIIGNNMLTGQNTFRFADRIDIKEGLIAIDNAATQIKRDLHAKGMKTHLTIWKDFTEPETAAFAFGLFDDYYKFSTQPNMVFDICESWHAENDYVSALNKKYRDQYKRARKKNDGITMRKLSLQEITSNADKIYELYFTVARNAPFNTFWLSRNHFVALKEFLGDKFLFYGYFLDEELIGFDTLIKNGESMDTYFLGYNENIQRDKMLYLNMLYNMIAYSINKKFRKVIFARTALEIKSSVGAKPVYLFGYIKHCNRLLNFFMPKLFAFFEPQLQWHERHPFKDAAPQVSSDGVKS
ncbi:8-amino-7-oxononanoate synthase [Flavobacterium longum]|uniref:8-amino-7-oxononanoate synthase n=1 Tax=Flavobacterium longum TaxID=1299340 RepID=UPI0039E7A68D